MHSDSESPQNVNVFICLKNPIQAQQFEDRGRLVGQAMDGHQTGA
jgi:hypothetical protein